MSARTQQSSRSNMVSIERCIQLIIIKQVTGYRFYWLSQPRHLLQKDYKTRSALYRGLTVRRYKNRLFLLEFLPFSFISFPVLLLVLTLDPRRGSRVTCLALGSGRGLLW